MFHFSEITELSSIGEALATIVKYNVWLAH